MNREDKKFIDDCKYIIKGLNDFSICHPETAEVMNKTTDMLERKIKETEEKYASNTNPHS